MNLQRETERFTGQAAENPIIIAEIADRLLKAKMYWKDQHQAILKQIHAITVFVKHYLGGEKIMKKSYMGIKKYSKSLILLCLILSLTILGGCSSKDEKLYEQNITQAEALLNSENYSEAKAKYEEGLKYKNTDEIKDKVELCEALDKSTNNFKQAETCFGNGNYLEAYNLY